MMLPVFLFTGFLDAGKTTFLQSMLEDPGFNEGQRTLVLLCEEGEEELDPKRFSINNVTIHTVDSVAELTPANMSLWQRKAAATRIMAVYSVKSAFKASSFIFEPITHSLPITPAAPLLTSTSPGTWSKWIHCSPSAAATTPFARSTVP